jgi:UDP-glucuronate decarboxylase
MQTRSFCYVDDLIDGLTRLMNATMDIEGSVNLGNPTEMTMCELAELIISLTGSRSRLEFRPLPQDDPRQRRPDISRARELLHWAPVVSVVEGLSRTIEYFDNLLSDPREVDKLVWKMPQ